jgi:hypothetical protein
MSDHRRKICFGLWYEIRNSGGSPPTGLAPWWAQTHLELFASKGIPAFR